MKNDAWVGSLRTFVRTVGAEDLAAFNGEIVHRVYATFALARDAEWTTRQFVLDICDDDEEGVGTLLNIEHQNPAFEGDQVIFKAIVERLTGNELLCNFEARVGDRIIATGTTGQRILKRKKIEAILQKKI